MTLEVMYVFNGLVNTSHRAYNLVYTLGGDSWNTTATTNSVLIRPEVAYHSILAYISRSHKQKFSVQMRRAVCQRHMSFLFNCATVITMYVGGPKNLGDAEARP